MISVDIGRYRSISYETEVEVEEETEVEVEEETEGGAARLARPL